MKQIRIATRKSPLALWQAKAVADLLTGVAPETQIQIIALTTEGDRRLDVKLADHGGKGLFLKELEQSLLSGEADIAVHSMKDMPAKIPEGLEIAAVTERADPRDAFVSNNHDTIDQLPEGATVGTSSTRRRAQLLNYRPDLQIRDLRGNLDTRLAKLDSGEYHAIILACAGLDRLERQQRIRQRIDNSLLLPATGQGVIAIECRSDNYACKSRLSAINHMRSWICTLAERSCGAVLEADCHMPLAVHATMTARSQIEITARVCNAEGTEVIEDRIRGRFPKVVKLGALLAETLLQRGARQLLSS